jgi:tetratricopeptide (TPR) repeat protein
VTISESEVPQSVLLVLGRRLDRLSEASRRLLAAAAVIGHTCTLGLLEAVVAVSRDALLDSLDEAERAHLIVSAESQREATVTFAHVLVRQTLLRGLSTPRRQQLHLRVADAIELVYRSTVEEHEAALAHHLCRAGTAAAPARTGRHLRRAAELPLASVAFEEALRYLDSALELQQGDDGGEHLTLLFTRGLVLRGLGRWSEAMAAWREALDISRRLGASEVTVHLCAEMALNLFWSGRIPEAVEVAERGLSSLGDAVSPDRAVLLGMRGLALSYAGDFTTGESLTTSAAAMAEGFDDARVLGHALNVRTIHHFIGQQCRQCVALGMHVAEMLRATGTCSSWRTISASSSMHCCGWIGQTRHAPSGRRWAPSPSGSVTAGLSRSTVPFACTARS